MQLSNNNNFAYQNMLKDFLNAAYDNDEKTVDDFLNLGANPNIMSSFSDNTALHYAAYNGNLIMGKSLIAYGANTNAKNTDGRTPLHIARRLLVTQEDCGKCVDFIDLLLNHGAQLSIKNKSGNFPHSNLTIITGGTPQQICFNEEITAKKRLYINRAHALFLSARLKDLNNEQALLTATQQSNQKEVIRLLNLKVNPNAKSIVTHSNTALHWAVQKGHIMIGAILLAHGADVNTQNYNGYTPLHVAKNLLIKQEDCETCLIFITLLLNHGARMTIKNMKGNRPDNKLTHQGVITPSTEKTTLDKDIGKEKRLYINQAHALFLSARLKEHVTDTKNLALY